jgi:hypothetical protein
MLENLRAIQMDGRRAIIFGANAVAFDIIDCLMQIGISLHAVVDNDPSKQGKKIRNYIIHKPQDILQDHGNTLVIFIASKYYGEMKAQSEGWGFVENRDIFQVAKIKDEFAFRTYSLDQFDQHRTGVQKGLAHYQSIICQYGEQIAIYLAPVSSVGDIFLLSLYFKEHLKYGNIDKYVMLIPGNAAAAVALWRGICPVEAISMHDADNLLNLGKTIGFEAINLKLLHTGYIHTSIWSRLLTLRKLTWLEHYRELFQLPAAVLPEDVPYVHAEAHQTIACFDKLGLQRGRTAILAPYTNNVRPPPAGFWERLASSLLELGYSVATNVGNDSEKPIKNTIALRFLLKDTVEFLEYAGFFISARSGLCDIAASAKCKKMIIYSNEIWDYIDVFDFCSLKKMGLCEDVEEYIYDYNDEELLRLLLANFKHLTGRRAENI